MKSSYTELAVSGGPPLFDQKLHVGRPNLGDRKKLLNRFESILERNWLTNGGPLVREFEQRIADQIGVKNAVAMVNGTVALEIAIRALDLRGEVIIPSFTFVATAHALQWQEITPVFCDIDPDTYTIDPLKAEQLITPRTSAIIGVHLWGRSCRVEKLEALARRYELKLLFDAAHAFGCEYGGVPIGNFGELEVFSFHATKFVNSIEGGMVTTNNDELAAKIRLMRNFGFHGDDNVIYIGTNGKMNEFSAAMGLTSLDAVDKFISINKRNYEAYKRQLDCIKGINLVEYDEEEQNNYQYVIIEVDAAKAGLTRDELQQILAAENILARRYFYPGVHQMEPYRSYFPFAGLLLPVTNEVAAKVLSLPTGIEISEKDVEAVCSILRLAVNEAENLKKILKPTNPDKPINKPKLSELFMSYQYV